MHNENKNWKKTFLIIWLGQAFSLLGSSTVSFAIIWWLTDKTGSATVLLVASLVSFLPHGIFGPFIGALVDRYNRKTIMMLSDGFIAIATSLIAIFGMFGEVSIPLIMIVLFMRSIGSAFHSPALEAATPLLVPEDKLTKIAGINHMLISGAQILGPIFGAALISFMSISQIVFIDIIGAIIAILSLVIIKLPELVKTTTEVKTHIFEEIKEGFFALKDAKGIFKLSILIAVVGIMYIPVGSIYPLMVKNHFNGGALQASFTETAFGVGMIIGSIVLGIWGGTKRKINTIIFSMILLGLTMLVGGLIPPSGFILFLIVCMFMGLSVPFFNGPYIALLQSQIDVNVMGRVFSIINAMTVLATPIGLLLAAPIAESFGVANCFVIFGIGTVILSIIPLFIKDIMNLEK